METAVTNAINLFNKLEPNAQNKRYVYQYKQITNYARIGIFLLIIGIVIYIYRDKIKKYLYNIYGNNK
jgi:hypothetical protein